MLDLTLHTFYLIYVFVIVIVRHLQCSLMAFDCQEIQETHQKMR